jgi:hypothetical protein
MFDVQYSWQLLCIHLGLFLDAQAHLLKALARYLLAFDTTQLVDGLGERHPLRADSFADELRWQAWLARRSSLSTALLLVVCVARDWLCVRACLRAACRALVCAYDALATDRTRVWRPLCARFFDAAKWLPPVRRRIRRELDVGLGELERQLLRAAARSTRCPSTACRRRRSWRSSTSAIAASTPSGSRARCRGRCTRAIRCCRICPTS